MSEIFKMASLFFPLLLLTGFGIWYLYGQIYKIAVIKYTFPVSGLPEEFHGFTLLHLSDLHSKSFGKGQKNLLEVIRRQSYDIAVITGDLVNRMKPETQPVFQLLAGIEKPVYFVPGNHEWETRPSVREAILSAPGVLLQNRAEKLVRGKRHIWIAGIDDQNSKKDSLEQALREVRDEAPVILLAHEPDIFDGAAAENVDLVLAGHTHGGQVRLPFIGALLAPDQGLFPKYDRGLYVSGSSGMIISSGLGESLLPLRFNNPPEILLITLTGNEQAVPL